MPLDVLFSKHRCSSPNAANDRNADGLLEGGHEIGQSNAARAGFALEKSLLCDRIEVSGDASKTLDP